MSGVTIKADISAIITDPCSVKGNLYFHAQSQKHSIVNYCKSEKQGKINNIPDDFCGIFTITEHDPSIVSFLYATTAKLKNVLSSISSSTNGRAKLIRTRLFEDAKSKKYASSPFIAKFTSEVQVSKVITKSSKFR